MGSFLQEFIKCNGPQVLIDCVYFLLEKEADYHLALALASDQPALVTAYVRPRWRLAHVFVHCAAAGAEALHKAGVVAATRAVLLAKATLIVNEEEADKLNDDQLMTRMFESVEGLIERLYVGDMVR